jgi:hypothetical protein
MSRKTQLVDLTESRTECELALQQSTIDLSYVSDLFQRVSIFV